MKVVGVVIGDDNGILGRGLKEILLREVDDAACGEAGEAAQVLYQVRSQPWDLVILDVSMRGRSGLDVLSDLKQLRPELPVLVLSMHPEDQYAKRVLGAGAVGYMNKETAPEELVTAIRRVLAGGRYVSTTFAERLASDLRGDPGRPTNEILSKREFAVLRMIESAKSESHM